MQAQNRVALSSDGVPIHYDVQGSGPIALVFVHGWCCNRGYWEAQVDHFAARYTVVNVDLAGHGASGRERTRWSMPAFGLDVVAAIEHLELEQVVLIGHSMGGVAIVEAARRLPNAVVGLIGVETWRSLGQARTPEQVAELVAPFRTNFVQAARELIRTMFVPASDPALAERVIAAMSAAPPQVAIGALEAVWGHDLRLQTGLRETRASVIAINSSQTNPEATQRHGIAVKQMSGVGHFAMLENPPAFNLLLDEAVRECLDARTPQDGLHTGGARVSARSRS